MWNTNMGVVSLLCITNMADGTSCENAVITPYKGIQEFSGIGKKIFLMDMET